MSTTEKYVEKALGKLSITSSHKTIFNVLVEIRTKVIKSKTGLSALISKGAVSKLLHLIPSASSEDVDNESHNTKITDIVLSVLGNLCMEDGARNQV